MAEKKTEPRPRMTTISRRGDSVVMTPAGKYVSVNGEPVDPDTGIPITRPVSVNEDIKTAA
ncbi:MAG TPA: hypothetical protein VJT81_06580 [Burkholderiales bacterium]|nr:hypothetical protein [Burkholderiales bacterium]